MHKLFLTLAVVATLWACHKPDPAPVPYTIEGAWARLTDPEWKGWHYTFQDNILTMAYHTGPTVVSTLQYPYAERGDTLLIGGDTLNDPQTWVLHFECAEVVEVRQVGAMIGERFWLKKIE